jgi:hypothetical protein
MTVDMDVPVVVMAVGGGWNHGIMLYYNITGVHKTERLGAS